MSLPSSTLIKVGCQTNAWPINPTDPQTLYETLSAIHRLGFDGFETGFRNVLPIAEQKSAFQRHQQGLTFFGVTCTLFAPGGCLIV